VKDVAEPSKKNTYVKKYLSAKSFNLKLNINGQIRIVHITITVHDFLDLKKSSWKRDVKYRIKKRKVCLPVPDTVGTGSVAS
jgi:hypothetical protein